MKEPHLEEEENGLHHILNIFLNGDQVTSRTRCNRKLSGQGLNRKCELHKCKIKGKKRNFQPE